MSRKPKFSSDEKVSAVNLYLDGKSSMNSIAKQLGISYASFVQWSDHGFVILYNMDKNA